MICFTPAALLFNALLFYLYAEICTDLLAQIKVLMFPKMLCSGQYLKQLYHPLNTNCSLRRIVTLSRLPDFCHFLPFFKVDTILVSEQRDVGWY